MPAAAAMAAIETRSYPCSQSSPSAAANILSRRSCVSIAGGRRVLPATDALSAMVRIDPAIMEEAGGNDKGPRRSPQPALR